MFFSELKNNFFKKLILVLDILNRLVNPTAVICLLLFALCSHRSFALKVISLLLLPPPPLSRAAIVLIRFCHRSAVGTALHHYLQHYCWHRSPPLPPSFLHCVLSSLLFSPSTLCVAFFFLVLLTLFRFQDGDYGHSWKSQGRCFAS